MNRRFLQLSAVFMLLCCSSNFCYADTGNTLTTSGQSSGVALAVNGNKYQLSADDLAKIVKEQSKLVYNPQYKSEIENTDFCHYEKSIVCELTFSLAKKVHIQKEVERTIDQNALSDFVSSLSKQTDTPSVDAKLNYQDGKASVFALSQSGFALDQDKSKIILTDFLKSTDENGSLSLPGNAVKPEISTDSIDNMGITTLLAEGQSNFAGSPANRVHNIIIGAQRFNGVLIKPGAAFSFLSALGPVDASTGYLPELSIVGNATLPEYGGGMCQVSTTAFRAALNAGLKITERVNHAYPVSYYNPQGLDATVYIPQPDLRFVNNTPDYILIQTRIVGTLLYFDFYGTSDGRNVQLVGPTIIEHNPDGSMKTTLEQIVKDKNGNTIIDADFPSDYKSPSHFPPPGQQNILTEKPRDWSQKQWRAYKQAHGM